MSLLLGSVFFTDTDPITFWRTVKPGVIRLQVSSFKASRAKWVRAAYVQLLARASDGTYQLYEGSRLVKFPSHLFTVSGADLFKVQIRPVPWVDDLRVTLYQDSEQSPIAVYVPSPP